MKKNIIAGGILVLLISVIGIGYYSGFKGNVTNANPDYICTKSVTAQPCKNVVWGAWQIDGTRTGVGTKATQFRYYATRTGCSAGYTATRGGGYTGGASGRKTADFVSASISCTITQVDNIAPVGTFK